MKKVFAIMIVGIMLFALAGCAGSGAGSTPADPPAASSSSQAATSSAASEESAAPAIDYKTDLRLASHNAVIEGNNYRVVYERNIQEAAAGAAEYGLNVSYASFVSNWDPSTESQQVENSVNEGYDVILVNPVAATGLDPIIEKAIDAGIQYVNCDCEYYSDKILNVATDQYYLGYKAATYAGEVLGRGAKVVMINAIAGNAANEQRAAGFEKGIEEQGLEVIGYYNHNWNTVLGQQLMTEIINSGAEFDGVLTSQGGIAMLNAYDVTGAALPKFIGFCDGVAYMQKMLEINAKGEPVKVRYIYISNPPGVGGSGLNFALNRHMGYELKEGIYSNPEYNSIFLQSKIWYTDENQEEYRDWAMTLGPNDTVTYWLTIQEIRDEYFK